MSRSFRRLLTATIHETANESQLRDCDSLKTERLTTLRINLQDTMEDTS